MIYVAGVAAGHAATPATWVDKAYKRGLDYSVTVRISVYTTFELLCMYIIKVEFNNIGILYAVRYSCCDIAVYVNKSFW